MAAGGLHDHHGDLAVEPPNCCHDNGECRAFVVSKSESSALSVRTLHPDDVSALLPIYRYHCALSSQAHSAVDAHAEEEFQLSRAKLILQASHGVAKGRLPAPFNLVGAVTRFLVDIPHAIRMLGYVLG